MVEWSIICLEIIKSLIIFQAISENLTSTNYPFWSTEEWHEFPLVFPYLNRVPIESNQWCFKMENFWGLSLMRFFHGIWGWFKTGERPERREWGNEAIHGYDQDSIPCSLPKTSQKKNSLYSFRSMTDWGISIIFNERTGWECDHQQGKTEVPPRILRWWCFFFLRKKPYLVAHRS